MSRVLLLLALWGPVACKKSSERNKVRESGSAEQVGSDASKSAPATKKKSEQESAQLSETKVRGLVDEWLRSQNAGDFSSYEKLYAPKMLGIKRVGHREQHFDHAGWLADRRSMFASPFNVAISDLDLTLAGGVALVRFVQTWKNPRFSDVGPKQLVVTKQGEALQISREEMLESNVGEKDTSTRISSRDLNLVRVAGNELRLLLTTEPELNWMKGHPYYSAGGQVVRPVAAELVPADDRALLDETFELFDESGARCVVEAKSFEVIVDVIPHFGVTNRWAGGELADGAPPTPAEERALQLWKMSKGGGRYLSLRVVPKSGEQGSSACKKPVWGRVARTVKNGWTMSEVTGAEAQRLAKIARGEPGYTARLKDKDAVKTTGWTPETSVSVVRTFSHTDGRRYAAVGLNAPEDWCGGYDRLPYWVLLRLHGDGAAIMSDEEVGSRTDVPLAAVDVKGLDEPLFVSRQQIVRYYAGDGHFRLFVRQEPFDLDCAC